LLAASGAAVLAIIGCQQNLDDVGVIRAASLNQSIESPTGGEGLPPGTGATGVTVRLVCATDGVPDGVYLVKLDGTGTKSDTDNITDCYHVTDGNPQGFEDRLCPGDCAYYLDYAASQCTGSEERTVNCM
jgi:hypothetical protein